MYGLLPRFHREEEAILHAMVPYAASMGLPYNASPPAEVFLKEDEPVRFGNASLDSLFTPGHSPGSLSFFSPEDRSEEHTSELQSLMRISYAVFCLQKKKTHNT